MTQFVGHWEKYGLREPIKQPLRFGLLLGGLDVSAWQAICVDRLIGSGVAQPALIVVPASGVTSGDRRIPRSVLRHAAYHASSATLWRPRSSRSVSIERMLQGVSQLEVHTSPTHLPWVSIAPGEVAEIRAANLDFLLAFGFGPIEGEILDCARHGVWSFHHGDERRYRGWPAGFWELYDGSQVISVSLQRLSRRLDGGTILKRGAFAVDPASYARTLDRAYSGAMDFPLLVSRDILMGRAGYLAGPPSSMTARVSRMPDTMAVLRVHAKVGVAAIRRVLFGAFVLRRWSVGRLEGGAERVLSGQFASTRWYDTDGRTRFLADPILAPGTRGRVLLVEQFDYRIGRGTIGRVTGGAATGERTRVTTLIDEPGIHLSYPSLVTLGDGTLWCTPEAAETGGLLGYRLSESADRILARGLVLGGFAAVDPTIFQCEGRWWLACTEAGETSLSHLWLFYADSPAGPWLPHLGNPVLIDAGSARPAGPPFVHAGSVYRLAQDSRGGYGKGVVISRIVRLTHDEFQEEPVATIRPDPLGPNRDGLHTISIEGDAIAIDGYRNVIHPLAGWFRVQANRRRGGRQSPMLVDSQAPHGDARRD